MAVHVLYLSVLPSSWAGCRSGRPWWPRSACRLRAASSGPPLCWSWRAWPPPPAAPRALNRGEFWFVKKKIVYWPLKRGVKPSNLSPKMHFFNDFPIIFWSRYIWYFAGVTPIACKGLQTTVWFKINNDLWFGHHWLYSSDLFWPKKEAKLCNRRAIFWTRMQRIPIHNKYYSISQLVLVKESPNIFSLVHPTYLCDSFTRSFNWLLF